MAKITPVVLCGGSGTRLWPRSRAVKPKPFLPLVGDQTLFELTLSRAGDTAHFTGPVIVTGVAHLEHVEAQLAGVAGAQIMVEPAARNTAAAIALAALRLPEDAVMLVCPSDHHIGDPAAFQAAALTAAALAEQGWLVAFGIGATGPETGFGYIKQGEAIAEGAFRVERFVEKPDLDTAKRFLAEGGYAWNGGIFALRAGDFLRELGTHRPDILAAVQAAVDAGQADGHRFQPDAALFAAVPSDSIDYAVMEKTDRAAVVPAVMAWSDIGNWAALHEARDQDAQGNSIAAPEAARVELVDCQNVCVETDGPNVSIIGLKDVIVVVDGNDIMVTTADGVQKVGKLFGAANQ
ncbi:NTP transferase domain-containing protein [Novosphingobium sp. FSY-8]|uniref:NTP transferase domain-containing protein n=1 Tax=Novosphingobium ovatum TaxID=1908523 RepID=A0ABW9XEF8_9SPHN|nr:sugar phosphate nucleotidyltransferase [Novosphingobium ovatum]NBC36904.1 NTP transferase domain-containing protein [Novosphingobium ovatum]